MTGIYPLDTVPDPGLPGSPAAGIHLDQIQPAVTGKAAVSFLIVCAEYCAGGDDPLKHPRDAFGTYLSQPGRLRIGESGIIHRTGYADLFG